MTYQAAETHISHDTQAGETVVINFGTGSYFSMTGSASDVWVLTVAGHETDELTDALAARYDGTREVIAADCATFLSELVSRGLLNEGGPSVVTQESVLLHPVDRAAWVAPQLQAFDDLNDLILMDPIHEVDEAGWPHPKGDVD